MNKIVIFDMDGLLINSEPVHFKAVSQVMDEVFDHSLTQAEYNKNVLGKTLKDGFAGILKDNNFAGDISDLLEKKKKYFLDIFEKEFESYTDAVSLAKCLMGKTRLAVVSGSQKSEVYKAIQLLGFDNIFEAVVTLDDIEKGKPSPEPYLLAAKMMGVNPKDCVVIEDTAAGVSSGNAAGMTTVAVTHTNGVDALSEADLVVDDLTDPKILDILD